MVRIIVVHLGHLPNIVARDNVVTVLPIQNHMKSPSGKSYQKRIIFRSKWMYFYPDRPIQIPVKTRPRRRPPKCHPNSNDDDDDKYYVHPPTVGMDSSHHCLWNPLRYVHHLFWISFIYKKIHGWSFWVTNTTTTDLVLDVVQHTYRNHITGRLFGTTLERGVQYVSTTRISATIPKKFVPS